MLRCQYCAKPVRGERGLTSHVRQAKLCTQARLQQLAQEEAATYHSDRSQAADAEHKQVRQDINQLMTPSDSESDDFFNNHVPQQDSTPPSSVMGADEPEPSNYVVRTVPGASERGPRRRTRWEENLANEKPDCPFFPWSSADEFEFVAWLSTSGLSAAKIDNLLKEKYMKQNSTPLSFNTAKDMYSRIKNIMEPGPAWKCDMVTLDEAPTEPQFLFYRDPLECVKYLLGNPTFSTHMEYEAKEIYESDGATRVYHEMFTGVLWNEIQDSLPEGTSLIGAILASDKTHLTEFSGDKSMHAVYISIGNIHKDIRAQTSRRAYIVLAYLPVTKFSNTDFATKFRSKAAGDRMPGILASRLFHRCMTIVLAPLTSRTPIPLVDAEGYERSCVTVLMAYIADLEEQWKIACVRKNQCPNCSAGFHELGTPGICRPRTSASTLAAIALARQDDVAADTWGFILNALDRGLCGVEHPFWASLGIDIGRILCQDVLHGLHKAFRDHDVKWLTYTVGAAELDRRFRAQPHRIGYRNFANGISGIQQWSCKENRDLQRHIAVVVAGASGASPSVLKAMRSRLDFISTAQLPIHTDTTLHSMSTHLSHFHAAKGVYIKNGSRRGKRGVIHHMRIPKDHSQEHYFDNIVDHGTTDNYSTEASETMHIPSCKNAYRATNRKDYMVQVIRYLVRQENVHSYMAYLRWRAQNWNSDSDTDDTEPELFENPRIKLAKRPPRPPVSIHTLIDKHSIPGLIPAIARFVKHNDSGLGLFARGDYNDSDIPPAFLWLDVWDTFRIRPDRPNEFYKQEAQTVHSKPSSQNPVVHESFDPVLIRIKGEGTPLTLKDCRIGEVRLIFKPNGLNQPILAYVHWFCPIPPSPVRFLKLYQIHKQLWARGQRAGGVVPISSIIALCPLAPILKGACNATINSWTCYNEISSFYINSLASHGDYRRLS